MSLPSDLIKKYQDRYILKTSDSPPSMGRPKGSKNKSKDESPLAGQSSSAPPAPKLYSDAFKGMSFGKTTPDLQEVFQIRLVHPTQAITRSFFKF